MAAVLIALGFSLYRKYVKKREEGKAPDEKSGYAGSTFSSVKDDYEPYSKE